MEELNLIEIFEQTIKKKYLIKKCIHGKNKRICKECGGSTICVHGKQKSYCRDCGGSQFCIHSKIKSSCKECGGSQICEHGKLKTHCKECGGSQICEHRKRKTQCKECGGSQICEHGKFKMYCKECGGNAFCEHGKIKTQCKECGGSAFCEHGKQKYYCKECGGSQICEHRKRKTQCKECGGSQICEHGKFKRHCKECGGSQICEHGKFKIQCKECGGSQICEHGKFKTHCKECGGSQICEHGKFKQLCRDCDGSKLCKSSWCETKGNLKYNSYCLSCCVNLFPEIEVSRNYKTKEKAVAEKILEFFPNFTWYMDKRIEDGCSKRRPDFLLDMGTHIIIIEVDENQHTEYDCSCENKRLMEISQDLSHRPIVFIRFNPDGYVNHNGTKIKSCWKLTKLGVMTLQNKKEWVERIQTLIEQIQYWIDNPTTKTIEIIQLFYS